MHFLTRQKLHLSLFHPLMKLLLTMYIVSVMAGLWVAGLKYTDRAEWSSPGITTYVHGTEGREDEDAFGDPMGMLEEGVVEGKTRRELVDIVHPHLFTVPLVIFVLGHLLHLTRLPDALKLAVNMAAFLSMLATFLLPFVILDDTALGPVLYVCAWVMLVSFAILCLVPLWEMWLGRPGRGFNAIPSRRPGGGGSAPTGPRPSGGAGSAA